MTLKTEPVTSRLGLRLRARRHAGGETASLTEEDHDNLHRFEALLSRTLDLLGAENAALDLGDTGEAIAWGDPRGELDVVACGRCATCDAEVVASRDLLLVAGMRPVQRQRLRAAGVHTIEELAVAPRGPAGMNPDTFGMLRTQARLQLDSPAGTPPLVSPPSDHAGPPPLPTFEVVAPTALGALPRPDHGDLFFDFEGDPLHSEPQPPGREGEPTQWGIDYLFGWVDDREQYSALWAHSFAEEKRALETFLDIVDLRRTQHPGMHIYHYAPYEPSHLLAMAARHGVREADVDRLLRDGVFVDLYPIVRRTLRVGSRSYSIKKLEPLYMGAEVRTSDVQKGDDSIVRYVEARAFAADGDEAAAQEILDDLADYNRYDCVSTRRLRDWLVDRARERLRIGGRAQPRTTARSGADAAAPGLLRARSFAFVRHPRDGALDAGRGAGGPRPTPAQPTHPCARREPPRGRLHERAPKPSERPRRRHLALPTPLRRSPLPDA